MNVNEKLNAVARSADKAKVLLDCLIDDYGPQEALSMLFPFLPDEEQERLIDKAFVKLCGGSERFGRGTVIEHNGERMTVGEWARRLDMLDCTLVKRLNLGWSVERALTEPVRMTGTGRRPTGRLAVTFSLV